MKRCTIFVLVFYVINISTNVLSNEITKPLGRYLYEDLKCTPNKNGSGGEITSYSCLTSAKSGCVFENKKLTRGQKIADNGTDRYCRSNCICTDDGLFSCAEDDCFEELKPGCRFRDSLSQCCSQVVCEPPKYKCISEGKTYSEGAPFYPTNTCMSCVCQDGFTGVLEEPFCVKRRCLEQIFNSENLINNCAAAYFKDDKCCPATWVCNEGQTIEKISGGDSQEKDLQCDFGKTKVPYGYGFQTTVRPYSEFVKVECQCALPPFLTCLQV